MQSTNNLENMTSLMPFNHTKNNKRKIFTKQKIIYLVAIEIAQSKLTITKKK